MAHKLPTKLILPIFAWNHPVLVKGHYLHTLYTNAKFHGHECYINIHRSSGSQNTYQTGTSYFCLKTSCSSERPLFTYIIIIQMQNFMAMNATKTLILTEIVAHKILTKLVFPTFAWKHSVLYSERPFYLFIYKCKISWPWMLLKHQY